MTKKQFDLFRKRISNEAEDLKTSLWVLLEESDENSNIRETMNQLLDEIEALEPAKKEEI